MCSNIKIVPAYHLRNDATAASISKPIHNVKDAGQMPAQSARERAETFVFISGVQAGLPAEAAQQRRLVEPIGIEPMTPCLQSRCSPS